MFNKKKPEIAQDDEVLEELPELDNEEVEEIEEVEEVVEPKVEPKKEKEVVKEVAEKKEVTISDVLTDFNRRISMIEERFAQRLKDLEAAFFRLTQ